MGVKGLWKLLDGTRQPTSLELMEGKILAIDISLWLNMAIKGMRDVHGHSANDAHLITLFHRICKLLYFGVKPVFVFDGKAPLIKQRTLQERRERKLVHVEKKHVASQKLLQNYLKKQVLQTAIKNSGKATSDDAEKAQSNFSEENTFEEIKKSKRDEEDDLFVLPPASHQLHALNSSDDEREEQWIKRSSTREAVYGSAMMGDFKQMMSIDVDSEDFKSLPPDIQHELLNDIKEIRKRRRTQFETMPDNSKSFSNYQLAGLLAKREISDRIEKVEKKMQEDNAVSMSELGYLDDLHEAATVKASQLISDENTRFILINKLSKKSLQPTTSATKLNEQTAADKDSSSVDFSVESLPTTSSESLLEIDSDTDDDLQNNSLKNTSQSTKDRIDLDCQLSKDLRVIPNANDHRIIEEKALNSEPEFETPVPKTTTLSSDKAESVIVQTTSASTNDVHLDVADLPSTSVNPPSFVEIDTSIATTDHSTVLVPESDETSMNFFQNQIKDSEPPSVSNSFSKPADEESDGEFVDVANDVITKSDDDQIYQNYALEEKESSIDQSDVLSSESNPWETFESEDVNVIQEQLDAEDVALIEKMKSSTRAARDLSDVATSESQQLLQLFGIPYLVSPQEAESQCAYLDACGLTMGTITDDSDVLLFGGKIVFKSVFDRRHDPSVYSVTNIKAELGLERNHLINIALCSGSDYTIGIENAGPVAALEIMKEFPGNGIESLAKFKTWWDEAHEQVKIPPTESKIKGRLRKLNLPVDFPSQHVADAYLHPVVNESKESFSWGIPDLDAIRNFLIDRLHWTKSKVDDSLLPVLKRISERNSKKQSLISSYFPAKTSVIPPLPNTRKKKSKRVTRAIFGIAQSANTEEPKLKQKRKRTKKLAVKPTMKRAAKQTDVKLCLSESSSSDSS